MTFTDQETDWGDVPFIDYMNACDDLLDLTYGIGSSDCTDGDMLATAQEDGDTPQQFVDYIGEKYGLTKAKDFTLEKATSFMRRFYAQNT